MTADQSDLTAVWALEVRNANHAAWQAGADENRRTLAAFNAKRRKQEETDGRQGRPLPPRRSEEVRRELRTDLRPH